MRKIQTTRRGVTAVLAMLYLSLFSTLALGFYAATTSGMVVVENDRRGALAQSAAESGMEFIRYQLSQISFPPNTIQSGLFPVIYFELADRLNGTGNMSGNVIEWLTALWFVVGATTTISPSGASAEASARSPSA